MKLWQGQTEGPGQLFVNPNVVASLTVFDAVNGRLAGAQFGSKSGLGQSSFLSQLMN